MEQRKNWRMKNICFILCVCFTVAIVYSAPPVPASGYCWDMVFEDNFNGSCLDTSKWKVNYPWGNTHTHNHDAYCIAEQVTVQNGKLVITAEYSPNYNGTGYNYISGVITTSGKFNTQYGYIEGRFKQAPGQGTWPAFWTLQSGWPPEIDIFEVLNGQNTIYMTYHWGPDWEHHYSSGGNYTGSNIAYAFRNYGLNWSQWNLRWYYENQNVRTFSDMAAIADCDEPHYILVNLAVGGWAGTSNPANYPTTYECDWVRVWKYISAPAQRMVGKWRLDEIMSGPVCDATGNSEGSMVNSPILGQTGPFNGAGYNYAYDFFGGLKGVNTNTKTVVPATGDFSLFVWLLAFALLKGKKSALLA